MKIEGKRYALAQPANWPCPPRTRAAHRSPVEDSASARARSTEYLHRRFRSLLSHHPPQPPLSPFEGRRLGSHLANAGRQPRRLAAAYAAETTPGASTQETKRAPAYDLYLRSGTSAGSYWRYSSSSSAGIQTLKIYMHVSHQAIF